MYTVLFLDEVTKCKEEGKKKKRMKEKVRQFVLNTFDHRL